MTESKADQKKCVHFWIIESPDGRTSHGVCKYCGAVNDFSNDWHDILNNLNKRGARKVEDELEKDPVLDT